MYYEADQRYERHPEKREASHRQEPGGEGGGEVVEEAHTGRANQGGEGKHEHTDTKGYSDVFRE